MLKIFRMKKNPFLFLFLSLFTMDLTLYAKSNDILPQLLTGVDKASVAPSETFVYYIKLIRPEKMNLDIPEMGDKIIGLRIVDYGDKDVSHDDQYPNMVVYEKWYRLEADISGEYVLPAVSLQYRTSGNEVKELKTSEVFVQVNPLEKGVKESAEPNPNLENDIRDLKDIYQTKFPLNVIYIGLALFLLILLGSFLFRRYLKNRNKVEIKLPPYETAILELEKIKNWELLNQDMIKKYYFKLTDILKFYFEEEFLYPATDRTLQEIKKDLISLSRPTVENKKIFLEILDQVELIKYSDFLPQNSFHRDMHLKSIQFIELTHPHEVRDNSSEESIL